ncbi:MULTISPECIES: DUF2938 domain-containing protein [Roseobacteraceae]|uniref:Membrane protein n=1 Tax=Pseudosulfitobacter pseudonitzschiae TaxID=1402135 RepID=A0A221K2X2_9RHOB|nr:MULTISPECIES: DUF2938 domain-containing protein [Roseobacteraceae]ASM73346.1 membrane protein [Pseudosulfitobacter pseudonitzschiae]
MGDTLLDAVVVGIGATLVMDLVAVILKRGLGIQPLNYALVGRWFVYLTRGQVFHRPITKSPTVGGEKPIGWCLHYLIGIVFTAVFLIWTGEGSSAVPRLVPALAFGALTVLAPFLVLQPGMGAGLAARCTPRPGISRLKSLVAHLSFGAGIWLAGRCWSALV